MVSEKRKQQLREASKTFKKKNPNYFKEYDRRYYWKTRNKRLEVQKKHGLNKTREEHTEKSRRARELRPFEIQVGRYTNRVFVKEPVCTFSFCDNEKDLHFHHWRYRIPVQRLDFSTLCREHHNLIHLSSRSFLFLTKIKGEENGN